MGILDSRYAIKIFHLVQYTPGLKLEKSSESEARALVHHAIVL